MFRALASSRPMASSAAEVMFDVGALTTMTPAWVAAGTSTLSRPTPARAMTLSFLPAASASASIWVAERISTASTSASAGSSCGAVGSVDVPDLEVGAEGIDRRGRELLGDQDDGLGHVRVLSGGTSFGCAAVIGTASCRGESRSAPSPRRTPTIPWDDRPAYRSSDGPSDGAGLSDATGRTPRWPSGTRSTGRSRRRRPDDRHRPDPRGDEQTPHDDDADDDRPGLPWRHRSSCHPESLGIGRARRLEDAPGNKHPSREERPCPRHQ